MQERVVFFGGIHGAGKTTLSRRLAQLVPALHVTAGDLIRAGGDPGEAVTLDPVRKAVADGDRNQERLLAGLRAYRNRATVGSTGLGILLDGHFCLLDRHGTIADIPSPSHVDTRCHQARTFRKDALGRWGQWIGRWRNGPVMWVRERWR